MRVLHDALVETERNGGAIGHFNIGDFVIFKAVVASAQELKVPVLVGASEGNANSWASVRLPLWCGASGKKLTSPLPQRGPYPHPEGALEAAKAGFDSVVFDLSALPFEENVRQTKGAVEALKAINPDILVEGEIGDIGTGPEIHQEAPDLAKG